MGRRKRYSEEFKRETLRRAEEPGVSPRQLRRWRDATKQHPDSAFPGHGRARDQELMRLKRKLAKVEQERDFLKEAAAYFAKEST